MIFEAPPPIDKPVIATPATTYKIAVVCGYFGLHPFTRPLANLRRFLRQMERENVPVFGMEAYVDKPLLPDTGWPTVKVKQDQILWQKEALLNLAIKQIPEEYNAIAWIDPDVWFSNPNWLALAEDRLRDYPAVQLFDKAVWTDLEGKPCFTRPAFGKGPMSTGHPGFAWALRRSLWPLPGWYCTGGCDLILAKEWKIQGIISWIPGTCYHEYHGERKNRLYHERHGWREGLSARECVVLDPNGLMSWSSAAPEGLKSKTATYFQSRKEDG